MPQAGTRVEFTNLEKVLFEELGITKAKVLEYYVRKAPQILPILKERPLSLKRYPDGVGKAGFYEKNAPLGTPPWVKTFRVHSDSVERDVNYIVCNELDTLLWLANLATIEMHMPLSTADQYGKPDLMLFDIDPEPPAGIAEAVGTALLLKDKLGDEGLRGYPKTSGKKGVHVVVPIVRGPTFKEVREFVRDVGKGLAREAGFVRSEFSQTKEPGTVFVDYLQNAKGKTMVAPYSLRGTLSATVSMPLEWEDLRKGISPGDFTLLSVLKGAGRDPWADLLEDRQRLETGRHGE